MMNRIVNSRGVSLTELMVAVVIITVGLLGLMSVFNGVQKNVQYSRARTIAYNLVQEQMQILKQKNYFRVLVTTNPTVLSGYVGVSYDPGYFPPESILEGGISFQRLTLVEVAKENPPNIQALSPSTPDTGMKLITVSVAWSHEGRPYFIQSRNIFSNPDVVTANSVFTGAVTDAGTLAPLLNVQVNAAENLGWRDNTNAAGSYTINLSAGSYYLVASAEGYFTQIKAGSVGPNATTTLDFSLVKMSSGTVKGNVWKNDRPLLSQVVGGELDGSFLQEYVEIYNPTTWTWIVDGNLGLKYQRRVAQDPSPLSIEIDYSPGGTGLSPGGFYLFANTPTVVISGLSFPADAIWSTTSAANAANFAGIPSGASPFSPGNPNVIRTYEDDTATEGAGALELYEVSTGRVLDQLGWTGNGSQNPGFYETAAFPQGNGLNNGEQLLRKSSPAGLSAVYGPAYDSADFFPAGNHGNNDVDWALQGLAAPYYPRRTASPTVINVAGTPAVGAVVSCGDGLSGAVSAVLTAAAPKSAQFSLTSVATGTWTVFVTSNSMTQQIDNVAVTASSTVWIANAGTLPPWPTVGEYSVFLSSDATEGFVSGTIKDSLNNPITNPSAIVVTNGALNATAGANGFYFLRTTPGIFNITANPSNANANYVSQSSAGVNVALGAVSSGVDFILSQGGVIQGFVTRDGINPLPGIAVTAINGSGMSSAQEVTGGSGRFTLVNLSTGIYDVSLILGSGETSTPLSTPVTVNVGQTVFAGTFTVTGSMGRIQGSVAASGVPVRTGILIVASTAAISTSLTFSTSSLIGAAYYMTSSTEDGRYTIDVRGSTSTAYRVYAYYSTFNGTVPVQSTKSVSGITVIPGGTTSGVNFSW